MNRTRSIKNWEDVKDKVVLHLENYKRNVSDAGEKVYMPFLDLAVFFYFDWTDTGSNGIYINRNHLILWKKSTDDVFKTAFHNTFRKDNILVVPLETLLAPVIGTDSSESKLTVLTNKKQSYGAAMLLNIPELEGLAEGFGGNLYLLPSSTHEIMAVRADQNQDVSFLLEMVREINRFAVAPEDYLSDNIYFFDRNKREIKIVVPEQEKNETTLFS